MAVIAPKLIVLNNATFKVAANNYETSVSRLQLTPTTPKNKWKGIGGNSISANGTADWVCEVGYLQDWDTTNSFSKYLVEHAGETVVADVIPKAGGAGYRVSIVLEAGPIGGDVDAPLIGTVSMDVSGQPVVIPAA